jgi:hypothetical protein
MKLSEGQLRPLWPLLAAAWAAHCRTTGERVADSAAKTAWRRALLRERTGFDSLTKVPRAGKAYVSFMAALEIIGRAGIHWQMQLHGAEERPLQHKIMALIEEHDLDHAYAGGVVKKALGLGEDDEVPGIGNMKLPQLLPVLDALSSVCKRLTREVAA